MIEMKCEEMTETLSDSLKGLTDSATDQRLSEHLATCADCREEAAAIRQLWQGLGELNEDVPSDRMRARFYASLNAYAESESGWMARLGHAFRLVWPQQPVFQLGLSAALLLVGVLLGSRAGGDSSVNEIRAMRMEMQTMQRSISLSLMEHQSASERLRGVEWTQGTSANESVIDALLDAVRHDSSTNVRLAAVEALGPLLERPRVGRELLQAMKEQPSPMVQAYLAETLLSAQVEGSEDAVEGMLDRNDLDPTVRERLQQMMREAG